MDITNLFGHGIAVIGEVAQAHDGSLGFAHAYIDALHEAGADAVKFQTHIAASESTRREPWRVKFSREDETRYDYWKRMEFTPEQWAGLKRHAEEKGLVFMSSPFSLEAAKLLEDLGIKVWKIASGEVSDPWLMEYILSTKKPVIFSTGMSGMRAIESYGARLERAGASMAIMQCTSKYPSAPEDIGLNVLSELRVRFPYASIGYSDHSGQIYAPLSAAALGAELIEVHICMDRRDFGPDVKSSLDPDEFAVMARGVRYIERMKQNPVDKDTLSVELSGTNRIFSKSVCAARDIKAGETFTRDMLCLKKPGDGIPASEVYSLLGTKASRDFAADELIEN